MRGRIASQRYLAQVEALYFGGFGLALDDVGVSPPATSVDSNDDLQKLRQELREFASDHLSQSATVVAVTAITLNAFCNLLLDLLPLPTFVGRWHVVGWKINEIRAVVDTALIKGDLDFHTAAQIFALAYVEGKWTADRPLRQLVMTFRAFAEKLARVAELPREQRALKQEIEQQLRAIDAEIERREGAVRIPWRPVEAADARDLFQERTKWYIQLHEAYQREVGPLSEY